MARSRGPKFDVAAAHEYFSADCFNKAWDLLEKPIRTPEDERLMVALNQASIYHWLNRPDCEPRHLSVGYWQASRIHAVLRNAAEARRYADVCLAYSDDLPPFFLGYAHEALARAALVANDAVAAAHHLAIATTHAGRIGRQDDRELLIKDLDELKLAVSP